MIPSAHFYELAHRRLAGDGSPKELRELQALLEADPSLRERFAALEKIWRETPSTARTRGFDVEGAWSKLKAQLPSAAAVAPARISRPSLARLAWLGAAAALAIGTGAWWLAHNLVAPRPAAPQEIAWDTYESASHRLTVVVLGDGTRIHLSAQSKLRYPKVSLPDRREVFLEGEAYFEVVKNPLKPFSVRAPGLVTTVLGTTFNVRAFPDEATRAVSLLTGSIDVARIGDDATATRARLMPGQQLRFDADKPGYEVHPIDAASATGWMRDRLVFKDEPLESLARALARKFDVKTNFAAPELRRIAITADFSGQELAPILELVSLTTGVQCDLAPQRGAQRAVITFRAHSAPK